MRELGENGKKRKKNLKKWDWMRNKMETIDEKIESLEKEEN